MSENSLELKSSAFEIKDADAGEVTAIVATLGVVDKDGDVLLPGCIPDGVTVKLSAYNHDIITEGAPPVGIGRISVKGDQAIFSGRFFLSVARGREAFSTVKEMGADGEWSFGFVRSKTKTAPMTDQWRAKGARRLVTGLTAIEASPVLIGAGWGTQTLYTKGASEEEVPDPAIEAARLKAEEEATALRVEAEKKSRRLADSEAALDRRFTRGLPSGVR